MFVSGAVSGNLGLAHYYWIAAALLLLAILQWASIAQNRLVASKFILHGIVWLAFIESIIVLLQSLHFIPSKNQLFACTGTWVNPNVSAIFLAMALFSAGPARFLASPIIIKCQTQK